MLLLELHVLLVELLRLRARQRVEAELVDDARAVALLGTLLELAEGEEELLRVVALLELLRRGRTCVRGWASEWMSGRASESEGVRRQPTRTCLERALEDLARRLRLALLLLELGPLAPRLRVVVALHVALEDLACARGLVDAHLEAYCRGRVDGGGFGGGEGYRAEWSVQSGVQVVWRGGRRGYREGRRNHIFC